MKPIHYKSEGDIEQMRASARILSQTLGMLSRHIRAGMTGLELDRMAEAYIRDHQAIPAFLGLYDFPNSLCISINDGVVHGIPTHAPFRAGDIVSIDCGVHKGGWCADQAYSFPIEPMDAAHLELVRVTRRCLEAGIAACRIGQRLGDIGAAIQEIAEAKGYGVVTELVGHGIGRAMHEGPDVPNFGRWGQGRKLRGGMTLAIEPMINLGGRRIQSDADGWTLRTADGQPSAHFEHTVALMDNEAQALTSNEWIDSRFEGLFAASEAAPQ